MRTRSVFLWLPTTAYCPKTGYRETKWLERVLFTQRYCSFQGWLPIRFETDPKEFANGMYGANQPEPLKAL